MRNLKFFLIGFILACFFMTLASGAERRSDACETLAKVEITEAVFGVLIYDHQRRLSQLYPLDKVPGAVGVQFGWHVRFKTDKALVTVREEFELPEPPPSWGAGEKEGIYQISADRKTAVTQFMTPTTMGWVFNTWKYAPNDPTGPHKLRVYIDGVLVREFLFTIEPIDEKPKRTIDYRGSMISPWL